MECVVDDCRNNAGTAKGLCKKHYMRWYRHGDVHYKPKSARDRFWSRVDRSRKCWIWTGAVSHSGYGAACLDGRQMSAHRIAYTLHHGPIPDGMLVCHTCDNKLCTNPKHLFIGTTMDNMADKMNKGRHDCARGEKQAFSKLSQADVVLIRDRARKGEKQARLAEEFGVMQNTINRIVNRKRWKHVE